MLLGMVFDFSVGFSGEEFWHRGGKDGRSIGDIYWLVTRNGWVKTVSAPGLHTAQSCCKRRFINLQLKMLIAVCPVKKKWLVELPATIKG